MDIECSDMKSLIDENERLRKQLDRARNALGEARDSIITGCGTTNAIAEIDAALSYPQVDAVLHGRLDAANGVTG